MTACLEFGSFSGCNSDALTGSNYSQRRRQLYLTSVRLVSGANSVQVSQESQVLRVYVQGACKAFRPGNSYWLRACQQVENSKEKRGEVRMGYLMGQIFH